MTKKKKKKKTKKKLRRIRSAKAVDTTGQEHLLLTGQEHLLLTGQEILLNEIWRLRHAVEQLQLTTDLIAANVLMPDEVSEPSP